MRVGELSRRTRVSVPSIKYYLREGLLAPGRRTGPNQAEYSEEHVRRLRLVRALLDVGNLSVAAAQLVLAAVDDEDRPLHMVLGTAQHAMNPSAELPDDEPTARARARVAELVARRGWQVVERNPGWPAAVEVLATYERLGHRDLAAALEPYADAMETLAAKEVEAIVAGDDREQTVEGAVTGMVLGASLLTALRTMAQEAASARRLGSRAEPGRRPQVDRRSSG